jgi:hypothetical protein
LLIANQEKKGNIMSERIGLIGVLVLIVFILIGLVIPEWIVHPSGSQLLGIFLGICTGGLVCFYLHHAWDPANLHPRNTHARTSSMKRNVLIVVLVGTILSNIGLHVLSPAQRERILAGIVVSIAITFGYVIIQAWRYRLRR